MKTKKRILWIEDGARHELVRLSAPVSMSDGFDLEIAESASDGVRKLLRDEFQVLIVDIRLPPGDDARWIQLYNECGRDPISARLGGHILHSVLASPTARVPLSLPPAWLTAQRIAILSVESKLELAAELAPLRIAVYEQKRAGLPNTTLLDVAARVLRQA
jgi:hypothetical protein